MINKIKNPDYIAGLFVFLLVIIIQFSSTSLTVKLDSILFEFGSGYMKTEDYGRDQVMVINIGSSNISGDQASSENEIAELIGVLNDNGAKFIGLSIPFGRDTGPGAGEIRKLIAKVNAYPPGEKDPDFKKWILENLYIAEKKLAPDSEVIEKIKKVNNVIIPVPAGNAAGKTSIGSQNLPPDNLLNAPGLKDSHSLELNSADLLFPEGELLKKSSGFGHIVKMADINSGRDFIPVVLFYRGRIIPGLPLRMACSFYNVKPSNVTIEKSRMLIGDKTVPLVNGNLIRPAGGSEAGLHVYSLKDFKDKAKLPRINGRVVFIGDEGIGKREPGETQNSRSGLMAAKDFLDIINSNAVSRPFFMPLAEALFLFILIFVFIGFFSKRSAVHKSIYALLMLALITSITIMCFSTLGIWLKASHIIIGVLIIYLYLTVRGGGPGKSSKESDETIRLLALNLQSQGELDEAFNKFRKLPLDKEVKDLIYELGREYEERKLIGKAVEVYKYINKNGGFRDLDDRIPMLRASEDQSSTMGSYGRTDDSDIIVTPQTGSRSTVGRYKIIGELGKGSMGLVYKAQDPKINRLVAIKTIRFSDEFDEDVISDIKERFFMEAEIAGKLSHPSIVTIHDVGDDQDLTYMAMEFLEGEDLEKYIKKDNLLPVRRVLDIIADIAEALDFAHRADVIHRDIKPANVMLLNNGHVKVTDFGIAKAISSSKTKTGVILGTPNYMSPEQIMGQKIDSKSDIFSLGILFYQLLTGELPFHGENLSGLLYQITQVKHSSPRNYNRKIPKVCEQIIDKALVKDPGKRFRAAGDMAKVIRALADKIDQLRMKKASGQ